MVAAVAAVSTIALLLGAAARGASTGVTLIGAAEARPVVGEDAQELGVASSVQGVKAQEAASEAEMKRLMAITHKKSEDLRRVLDGDTFNPQVLAKHATAAHPGAGRGRGRRIRARAAPAPSRVRAAAPAVSAGYPVEGVDERIATLFGAARSRLLRDVKRTLRDLKRSPSVRVLSPGGETSVQVSAGAQFKRQQVLRLMHDKAAVTGDERLLGLLAAKQRQARAQELRDVRLVVPRERMDAIDLFARRDLLRAASAGDAPRLHAHKLSKAGNVVSKVAVSGNPFAPESLGLLGGEQGDRGSQVIDQREGLPTRARTRTHTYTHNTLNTHALAYTHSYTHTHTHTYTHTHRCCAQRVYAQTRCRVLAKTMPRPFPFRSLKRVSGGRGAQRLLLELGPSCERRV